MRFPVRLLALLGFLLLGRLAWASTSPTTGRPLAEVLNADGTLKPGMAGSFDPTGYELVDVAGSRQPTFRPVSAKRTQGAGDEKWRSGFGLPGVEGPVYAVAKAVNGDIYVGGNFTVAGTVSAFYVARWNGSTWAALVDSALNGLNGVVYALTIGNNGLLYAATAFRSPTNNPASRVLCWNGSSWSALGADFNDTVRALAMTTDGTLYAGGNFTGVGSTTAYHLAKWDGTAWRGASATNSAVLALAARGNAVYVGGAFGLFKYEGNTEISLGTTNNVPITALAVDDNGILYAGGTFTSIDNTPANNLARWNGTAWSAVGTGLSGTVRAITMAPNNTTLYVGGDFVTAGGTAARSVARWDGTTWQALGQGLDYLSIGSTASVTALVLDNANNLYAGGNFEFAGGVGALRIARWNGTAWNNLNPGLDASVLTVAVAPNGDVYAGGYFTTAGGQLVNHVARWDGTTWHPLGTGVNGHVNKLLLAANGTLYAGGGFTSAGGVAADRIAQWNGTAWSSLGQATLGGEVYTMLQAGNGDLYVGGVFTIRGAGNRFFDNIARWDGTAWQEVYGGTNGAVRALALDASGQLYVGGRFTYVGVSYQVSNFAMWNTLTSQWASFIGIGPNDTVHALLTAGNGSVYIGGDFTSVGNVAANYIVRYDNIAQWVPLGSGANSRVGVLQQDAAGHLYASGGFNRMAGIATHIASWNGSSWSSAFGGGMHAINDLVVSGNRAYAGGYFTTIGDQRKVSAYFGIYDIAPTLATQTFTLPENSATGTAVGTVQATGSTTYSITAGNTNGAFAINSSTGALTVATAAALDFETTPSFALTVQVTDGTTPATATVTVNLSDVAEPATWNGSQSTDWYLAANWTPAQVPTASTDAGIPSTAPRMPLIASGSAATQSLSIGSGAALNMTGGSLDVQGDLTNNGTLVPSGGTIILGSLAQNNGPSILGSSRVHFWNLTLNSGGVLLATSAGASIRRLATLNGALVTQGNELVLESDATGTALTVNNPGGTYFGLVTVQRYIAGDLNAGAGYRHLSPPVALSTVGGLATTGFAPVVNAAYNTSATPGMVTPFPTVFAYDQARLATTSNNMSAFDKGWLSPATSSAELEPGHGYTVNVAAGRSVSFVGAQNNGDLTRTLARNTGPTAADAGWHHVGNPYPAPLDYSLVSTADRPNLDAAIYVFESTTQYGGNYRSYVNGVGGNPVLPMAQGFWVRVSPGQTSGSLTFRNSQRLTSYQNPTFHRTSTTRPLVQLQLQAATGLRDDAYVYFEPGATTGPDREFDAVKLPNTHGLNLSAVAGNVEMAINGLPLPGATTNLTVPLQVRVPATGSYTLHAASIVHLPAGMVAYLRDLQTGAVQDLSQQPDYTFSLNAAYTGVRFELFFTPQRVTGVAPASLSAQVAVFPNPAHKAVFVELPASLRATAVMASLVDALGRTVRTQPLTSASTQLALEGVAAGMYALRLTTAHGIVTKKLTVE